MARTYTRDARGRFASKGASNLTTTLRGAAGGRAPRRLEFLRTYHGTDADAARSIRRGGYRESRGGMFGAAVYTTARRRTAQSYAETAGDPALGGSGPAVIAHRILKSSIATGKRSRPEYEQLARSGRPVRVDPTESGQNIVMLNKAIADRTIIRESGMIRRRRRR